jgi:spore coat protein CotH
MVVLFYWLFAAMAAISLWLGGCSSEKPYSADAGTDADTDTDTDADTDCDWAAAFDEFFAQDRVLEIAIDFDDPNAWSQMLVDMSNDTYWPATVTIDGEAMTQVGVRFKGNSSLQMSGDDNTKSLKLDFEQYVPDQAFHCVSKLSLNNATKDPSMIRERLGYDLARELGITAPRTAHAEVTVDGALHGVFTVVQQVDHAFLKGAYGTADGADDGNLYKLYSDYDFSFLGDDATAADYGDATAETGLVLKTNEDDPAMNTYADVTALTKALDAVLVDPSAGNRAALEALMDVDSFLRLLAWHVVISNLDSPYSMTHNLYVYHNPITDLFEAIPWDVNEAFGSFQCMGGGPSDPPTDDVYTVDLLAPCGAQMPLNRLASAVPEYQALYCGILNELVDVADVQSGGIYNVGGMDARIATLRDLLAEARQRMDDEGTVTQPPGNYTYDDFLTNQGHTSVAPTGTGSTGPGPGAGPNLGYFDDLRLDSLIDQIAALCG